MAVHHNSLFRLDAAIKADFVRVKPKVNEATVNDYVQVKILIFKILLTRRVSQPIRSAFGDKGPIRMFDSNSPIISEAEFKA